MAKKQITDASLVAARQLINEHLADVNNPHDVTADQTGAMSQGHDHTKSGLPDTCSFTRASTVWWKKKQLENNMPRIDPKLGTLIEESTTNLLTAGAENFVTGFNSQGGAVFTITPNQPDPWGGFTAYRVQSTGGTSINKGYFVLSGALSNPHTCTGSILMKVLSGNANITISGGSIVPATQDWSRVVTVGTFADTYSYMYLRPNSISDSLDFLACQPQGELKPYDTSYTPPGTTRAAESLSIPVNAVDLGGGVIDYSNAVLNPTAGTIEFDFTPTNDDKSATKYIMAIGADDNNCIYLRMNSTSGYYSIYHRYNSGTVRTITSTVIGTVGVVKKHKIRFSGTELAYYIDGVRIGTTTYDGLNLTGASFLLGSYFSAANLRNGYLSNLRISKIARTDTEMAYTGTLVADEYTTFYNSLTGQGKQIKHIDLTDIGVNTHPQIDTALTNAANHLSNVTNPHGTTAAQVGAVPNIGISSVDANTLKSTGNYYLTTSANIPESYCQVFVNGNGIDCAQLAICVNSVKVYARTCSAGGGWSTWKQVYPAVLT